MFFMLEKKVSGVPAVEVKGYSVLSFDSDLTGEYIQFSGVDAKKVLIDFLLQATLYAPSVLKDYDIKFIVDCAFDLNDDTLESLLISAGCRDNLLSILANVDADVIAAAFENCDSDEAYEVLADVADGDRDVYTSLHDMLHSLYGISWRCCGVFDEYVDWDAFLDSEGIYNWDGYYIY